MSPSEFDLRAALREGEGDAVNPETIIGLGRAARHRRRVQFGSVAAGIAALGLVGVGVTTFDNGPRDLDASGGGGSSVQYDSNKSAGGAAAPSRQFNQNLPGTGGRSAPEMTSATNCPATPPLLAVPGGGGSGQFGSGSPMFARKVAAVKVCGYVRGNPAVSTVLSGSDATQLVRSVETAATKRVPHACASDLVDVQFVLYAVDAAGKTLDPVVARIGCGGSATNGTAVRYDWTPPATITDLLRAPGPAPRSAVGSPSR